MSRRHAAEKREVLPDPKFKDLVITKFMNALMKDGKSGFATTVTSVTQSTTVWRFGDDNEVL